MTFFETLFGLEGRLNRAAYIGYSLSNCVVLGIVVGVLAATGLSSLALGEKAASGPAIAGLLCAAPLLLASAWIGIALGVKRLHDMDMSGAHMVWIMVSSGIVGSIPVIGWLFSLGLLLWLWCTPGTDGSNRFGQPRVGGTSGLESYSGNY